MSSLYTIVLNGLLMYALMSLVCSNSSLHLYACSFIGHQNLSTFDHLFCGKKKVNTTFSC
jgi:hypothetical protein